MKIAYVCADPGVPVFGPKGCSVHVQEVIRAMVRQGSQVDLFATRTGGQAPSGFEGVTLHRLPAVPNGELAAREAASLAANRDLRELIESHGPYDMVYERHWIWSHAAMECAHEQDIPGLLEVNAPLIEEQSRHRGLVDSEGAQMVARRVFRAAEVLVAVSAEVAVYLKNHHPETRGRVCVIPNAVDPNRFPDDIEPAYPKVPGRSTIGFLGTLKPWHGLDILIEAYAMLCHRNPALTLLIVGDGPERERIVSNLEALNLLDTVRLTGAISPDQVPHWLACMDVAVAPYTEQPGFYFSPLKIYEYMAAGLPVVASRIGQVQQLVDDGATGLLCPPGDPRSLAAAIESLLQDRRRRQRMGRTARVRVRRDHTWDAAVGHILSLAGLAAAGQPG